MADTPKTTSLTGEEFKSLALTNVGQLHTWLTNIAPHLEGGAAGLTAEHIGLIEAHMNRCLMFLRSWSLTKMPQAPVQVQAPQPTNGAEPPKARGGWPKGRKRTPRNTEPAVAR